MRFREVEGITFSVTMDILPLPFKPVPQNPFEVPSLGYSVVERDGAKLLHLSILLTNKSEMEFENVEVHFVLFNEAKERIKDFVVMAGEVVERMRGNLPTKYVISANGTHFVGLDVDTEEDPHNVYHTTRLVRIRFHFTKSTIIREPDETERD